MFAAAVPAGTFLANLVPWSTTAHPAAWLYAVSVALALVIAGAALLGFCHRGPLAPFGMICLFTVVVLGIDVMTGSRLQLETPFGLSVLEAGRFYGIGNEALGIYGLSGLLAAAWLALVLLRRGAHSGPITGRRRGGPRSWPSRRWPPSPCSRRAGPGSAARWAAPSPWCPASCCWPWRSPGSG